MASKRRTPLVAETQSVSLLDFLAERQLQRLAESPLYVTFRCADGEVEVEMGK